MKNDNLLFQKDFKAQVLFFTMAIFALMIPTAPALGQRARRPRGTVLVMPKDETRYYSVINGQRLYRGDIIKTGPYSEVTLQCSRNSFRFIGPRIEKPIAKICRNPEDPGLGDPNEIRLGGNNPLIPYIVSPRYTRLLGNRPTLRWNAIEGATRYTVTLYREYLGEIEPVWCRSVTSNDSVESVEELPYPRDEEPLKKEKNCRSVEGNETVEGVEELPYPRDEKPLEEEKDYRLVVEADNSRSSQEEEIDLDKYDVESRGVSELRFRLFGETQAQLIREISLEITQEEQPKDDDLIFLASHYADNNLYAEAIKRLNDLIKSGYQKPDVYRILGDLYAQIGLNLLAKESYLKAIEQARSMQEVLEEALAQQDLGELYMTMHQPNNNVFLLEQAREQFDKALAKYKKLNRQLSIDEITILINQLDN